MRDALSLLDQAIAHGAGRVSAPACATCWARWTRPTCCACSTRVAARDAAAAAGSPSEMQARSLSFDSRACRSSPAAAARRAGADRCRRRSRRSCPSARASSRSPAARSGDGAALLPDRAAGARGPAARAGRARRLPDDDAEDARFPARGRRREACGTEKASPRPRKPRSRRPPRRSTEHPLSAAGRSSPCSCSLRARRASWRATPSCAAATATRST